MVIQVQYVGGLAAHVRQMLLSYLNGEGAEHRPVRGDVWPDLVCPVCTYRSDDVLAGVAWPCQHAKRCDDHGEIVGKCALCRHGIGGGA